MNPREVLKQYWGYDTFREKQEEIIDSVLAGRDTLALLPTGGGKSICFQVSALCMDGLCLVISPLIALMKDQVFQLNRRGISAKVIYSGMSRKEIDITLDNCKYGDVRFLYVSPERLKTRLFQERTAQMNISLVAIDEAHCISQWGYDFRPSYLEISAFLNHVPDAKKIALTATATPEVKEDIIQRLEFSNANVFQKSFARNNLSYSTFNLESKEQKLLEILNRVGGSSVVYVRTRRRTQEIASFLRSHKVSADFYHAGLSGEERSRKQDAWIQNQIRVIVSTNAFGMGIDKPDVRTVVHLDVPDSLEAYYQEAGRAGRDGRIAYAVILFHRRDIDDLMDRAESREVSLEFIQQVYQSLANYYKMAVGSHNMESLPFDISAFSESYSLRPTEVLKVLRNLSEAGVVQVSDGVLQQAKLHIVISKGDLYKFEVANAKFDILLKAILRLYGGELFSDYLFIKESDLVKLTKLSRREVVNQLTYLSEQGILDYSPSTDVPTLTFLTPRMVANELPIDASLMKFRKDNAVEKAKAMVTYLEAESKCRTRIFQEYFGEETLENCGVCDFCLNQKKNTTDVPLDKVMRLIETNDQTISSLYEQLRTYKQNKILLAVRMLIEEGKIRLEDEKLILV